MADHTFVRKVNDELDSLEEALAWVVNTYDALHSPDMVAITLQQILRSMGDDNDEWYPVWTATLQADMENVVIVKMTEKEKTGEDGA